MVASAPTDDRPFVVVVAGAKRREWGRYRTEGDAKATCQVLRRHGFDAQVIVGAKA